MSHTCTCAFRDLGVIKHVRDEGEWDSCDCDADLLTISDYKTKQDIFLGNERMVDVSKRPFWIGQGDSSYSLLAEMWGYKQSNRQRCISALL